MTETVFRAERDDEHRAIRDLQVRAFNDELIGNLIDRLRESPDWRGLSYVAERDGEIVGSVMFTTSLLDDPAALTKVLVLSPLAVAPEAQRQGVGAGLMNFALETVALEPEPLVFLEGDPAYYARFGFVAGGELGFRRPSLRIPEVAFQVRGNPTLETGLSGTLVYSRVFWDLDAVGLREPID